MVGLMAGLVVHLLEVVEHQLEPQRLELLLGLPVAVAVVVAEAVAAACTLPPGKFLALLIITLAQVWLAL